MQNSHYQEKNEVLVFFAQITKMQDVLSRRCVKYDKDIEDFSYDSRMVHKFALQFDMFTLKLMHMEKCKYITVNDFFDVNYSSMFKVSAAYFTFRFPYSSE